MQCNCTELVANHVVSCVFFCLEGCLERHAIFPQSVPDKFSNTCLPDLFVELGFIWRSGCLVLAPLGGNCWLQVAVWVFQMLSTLGRGIPHKGSMLGSQQLACGLDCVQQHFSLHNEVGGLEFLILQTGRFPIWSGHNTCLT